MKEKEDKKRKDLERQILIRDKEDEQMRLKKEQLDEYKFRRELDK